VNVDFVRVGTLAELPEGEVRTFELPRARVAVAHDERRLFAFAETCTGEGCPLADAMFDDRSAQLTCAACESVFDLETGEPLAGPAKDPLPLYSARDDDGWLEVSELPVR
jgi:3-phenylpropionate/trans-cinnamate dioxygenase ferredoxin component